jgi:hypothetical protein
MAPMLRLRLTHRFWIPFGSSTKRHAWVGQQWDASNEWWEDVTNEYPMAKDAELALLRSIVDVELEPVFEHGE